MTEKERERVRTWISERRKFIDAIVEKNKETISIFEESLKADEESNGKAIFPILAYKITKDNIVPMSKTAMDEIVDKTLDMVDDSMKLRHMTADEKNETAFDILEKNGYSGDEEIIVFGNAGDEYVSALIGVTEDGRAVYSYDKMVEWYMRKNKCDDTDAMEWINFNTVGSLPYIGEKAPIIIHDIENCDD